MKKLLYILAIVVSGLSSILTACSDEDMVKQNSLNIKEGVPVTVSIGFKTSEQKIQSRVEQSAETESNVSSLYIFVFNSDGSVDYKGEDDVEDNTISGLQVHSGTNKKIVAIANASNALMEELSDIDDEAVLNALTETMNEGNLNRSPFLMTCSYTVSIYDNGSIFDESENASLTNLLLKRTDAKITFKINLSNTIIDEEAGVTNPTNLSFAPTGFTVYNLPNGTNVLPQENDSNTGYSNGTGDFDSSSADNKGGIYFNFYMFENHKNVTSGKQNYITEQSEGAADAQNLYALRDKKTEGGTYVYAPANATYVVFTGTLSYEREKNGVHQWINASVSYTVHLGETGNTEQDYSDVEKVNNYTVNRNTHYTYTVTISGVNSIRVEVTDNKEERPGYEGDVIVAGAQVESMDCHYGRAVFYLEREALKKGLSWVIQTPFDNGIKLNTAESTSLKDYKWIMFAVNQEFGITSHDGIKSPAADGAIVNMVKFPGYGAYDGGAWTLDENSIKNQVNALNDTGNRTDNVLANDATEARNNTWKNRMPTNNFYNSYKNIVDDDACLRDINQLLNHLMKEANNDQSTIFEHVDGEERVYVTAFIDEYVYHYDPQVDEYMDPRALNPNDPEDQHRLQLWKKVVNGTPRLMHICTGNIQYSEDNNSSWTESVVTFSQSPVYSMYDQSANGLTSAWGTETTIEGNDLSAIPASINANPKVTSFNYNGRNYSNTTDNGRVNTLLFFVNARGETAGLKWGDMLNRTDHTLNDENGNELKTNYRDIWHACLIRNRDLDGDNIIEPEEIRWFLASVDELTDLWIGEDAMPESAHLYQEDGTIKAHVASSSYYNGSASDPLVIWAEEGASRGAFSGDKANVNGTNYYYRCIRYLGIGLDDLSETPQAYATYENGRMDVTYLASKAKRTVNDNGRELPLHFERGTDDMNKPYTGGFYVYEDTYGGGSTSRYWKDSGNGNNRITGFGEMVNHSGRSRLCPRNYRVPNQRELMLMHTRMGNELQGNYWCATRFSFNNNSVYNNTRPGFAIDSPNFILVGLEANQGSQDNISAKVRCVRDVTN